METRRERIIDWTRTHPWRTVGITAVVLPVLAFLAACAALWHTAGFLDDYRPRLTSRLYARPLVLQTGRTMRPEHLAAALEALDYREAEAGEENLVAGMFRRTEPGLSMRVRDEEGPLDGVDLAVTFRDGTIGELDVEGVALEPQERIPLGRPVLLDYRDPSREERRLVVLDRLPEHVVHAVLAAEDDEFFQHPGLSLTGIARAAWVNLRAGEIRQGGSTITQQLVKNLYLEPDRELGRKTKEAILALLTEARFGKRRILEAYLNEIYWGTLDGVQIMGLGAAARAYFGKDADELSVGEAAALAGMIQAPGDYSPVTRPEAARERRDRVLADMVSLGWLDAELATDLREEPLAVRPTRPWARNAPYFAAFAREEAERRFGVERLEGEGCRLLSTLDFPDQLAAEETVREQLPELEARTSKAREGELQAALVSLDPEDGGILAYVGGREWQQSEFDRASKGRRQAGSAFKPVVYAAAVARGIAYPQDIVRDSPILVKYGERSEWRPRNSDRAFRGPITVRAALEESRNVPAVRLAISTGLDRVRTLGREMGIDSPLGQTPSLALGAFEVTPLELATVYATLAAEGRRPTAHALEAIEDCAAAPAPLPEPERVLHPETAFLVTSMLQGSLNRGTAWRARRMGVEGPLAGKTGTSDDDRDAWFAGYSPRRATVVWVGLDENRSSGLSGAEGALPVWASFVRRVTPHDGPAAFSVPPGYETVSIDPTTGRLATPFCPRRVQETLPPSQVPFQECEEHRPTLEPIRPGGLGERNGIALHDPGPDLDSVPSAAATENPIEIRRSAGDEPPVRVADDPIELLRQRQQNPPPATDLATAAAQQSVREGQGSSPGDPEENPAGPPNRE